ncbi:MAG: RNA-binding protein [Candidatus Brockarchaeota archaeon]|nr:RNA-binding protein [Candidatus Brockarchaeota archaeon]MBO3768453.1 RNA-binding protein [Candidatus Brockarchaeota archaeon]MBO3801533.1 RNA-binding protein [Candidatus Brockarchaeota archaeon]
MKKEEIFTVKVGAKKVWSYVTAVVTHMNTSGDKVVIRARGRNIYKAVEVVNAIKRSFYTDLVIDKVNIVSDKVITSKGETKISAIEIVVKLPSEGRGKEG